jgi:hypothetical protein
VSLRDTPARRVAFYGVRQLAAAFAVVMYAVNRSQSGSKLPQSKAYDFPPVTESFPFRKSLILTMLTDVGYNPPM